VRFTAKEGDFHWVIYDDLAGAYQYFVNHALPVLGEFRTLWRLDNETFPKGRTNAKDDILPPLSEYAASTNVQDETWQKPDGSFLTKYDWSAFIREVDYYGVYGDEFGSWYLNPGKDYYNGDPLKQELMVCCRSRTSGGMLIAIGTSREQNRRCRSIEHDPRHPLSSTVSRCIFRRQNMGPLVVVS